MVSPLPFRSKAGAPYNEGEIVQVSVKWGGGGGGDRSIISYLNSLLYFKLILNRDLGDMMIDAISPVFNEHKHGNAILKIANFSVYIT